MNDLKSAFIPGLLAYVGVRAATMFAGDKAHWQIAAGIAGAVAGVILSKKI